MTFCDCKSVSLYVFVFGHGATVKYLHSLIKRKERKKERKKKKERKVPGLSEQLAHLFIIRKKALKKPSC